MTNILITVTLVLTILLCALNGVLAVVFRQRFNGNRLFPYGHEVKLSVSVQVFRLRDFSMLNRKLAVYKRLRSWLSIVAPQGRATPVKNQVKPQPHHSRDGEKAQHEQRNGPRSAFLVPKHISGRHNDEDTTMRAIA